jgi:hypothetical protein
MLSSTKGKADLGSRPPKEIECKFPHHFIKYYQKLMTISIDAINAKYLILLYSVTDRPEQVSPPGVKASRRTTNPVSTPWTSQNYGSPLIIFS